MDPVWTFLPLASASSAVEVGNHLHQVGLDLPVNLKYNMCLYIGTSLSLRFDLVRTYLLLALASLTVEVWDHHHQVGLNLPVNLMYNMSMEDSLLP